MIQNYTELKQKNYPLLDDPLNFIFCFVGNIFSAQINIHSSYDAFIGFNKSTDVYVFKKKYIIRNKPRLSNTLVFGKQNTYD
jgi:hypothetical protein